MRVIKAFWATVRRARRWSGFAAGVATGVVVALVVTHFLGGVNAEGRLEDGTIVIVSGADESVGKQQLALIDQWNTTHPKQKVEFRALLGVADDHYGAIIGEAESKDSDIDIFSLDVPWVAEFAERGFIREMPASDDELDGILTPVLETCRWNDKLWALPLYTNAGLLYYRSDLATIAPPSSLGQVHNDITEAFQSKKFQETPDDARPAAGYAGQLSVYEGLTVNALEAIWAAGGDVVDRRGKVVIDSPEARDGIRWLAKGLRPRQPQIIDPDARSYRESETTQAFRDGKVLLMRNWPLALRDLDVDNAEPSSKAPEIRYDVVPLPGSSALGGQNLAIAKTTDQPAAAQAVIEFLTSARSQQILFERGGFAAPREIVYHDQAVLERYPYARTLLTALRDARPRPITPRYQAFTREFRQGINEALNHDGELPVDFKSRLEQALRGHTQ